MFLGWIKRQAVGMVELALTLADRLTALPRNLRQVLLLALDSLFMPLALVGAHALAYDGLDGYRVVPHFLTAILILLASEYVFLRLGLYRAVIRYMGHQAILAIIKGVSLSTFFVAIAAAVSGQLNGLELFLYWSLALLLIGGTRLTVRAWHQRQMATRSDKVVIYGAGSAGRQLLTALMQGGEYRAVCFVDDDRALHGSVIHGVTVRNAQDLPTIIRQQGITQVLLAMPAISRQRRREILNQLIALPVYVRTIPAFADLVRGTVSVGDIRDIDLEDLLGRDPVLPRQELIAQCITGKSVLVTGAGGSIGAELCRQILDARPQRLVLVEQSEYALYRIESELRVLLADKAGAGRIPELVPLLGNAQDYGHMYRIYRAFAVETLYHAAAYKHVPMVEFNAVEGIRNNVFGTHESARAAVDAGVATFVLVSTDKAVRPGNVMGASKRLAELVLQMLSDSQSGTRFCMVRFGNVLGSSGSVVPLFREQIQAGGPVTVTHRDIIRYFMTVSEAAQLVLQAGAMARGGDVFVLNMGEPVRIHDLACRMIRLMGFEVRDDAHPEGEIAIAITGLRPGEKLYEELVLGDNITGTGHPMIMRAHEAVLSAPALQALLGRLRRACDEYDCRAISELLHEACAVPGMLGQADRVWQAMVDAEPESPPPASGKVMSLASRSRRTRSS